MPFKMSKTLFFISLAIFLASTLLHLIGGLGYEIFGYVKPITIIQLSGFASFALFLGFFRKAASRLDKVMLNALIVIAFMLVMGTLFEMLWSFGYWFSTYELEITLKGLPQSSEILDEVVYIPSSLNNRIVWNEETSLNTSAKLCTLSFMMSVYLLVFLRDVKHKI